MDLLGRNIFQMKLIILMGHQQRSRQNKISMIVLWYRRVCRKVKLWWVPAIRFWDILRWSTVGCNPTDIDPENSNFSWLVVTGTMEFMTFHLLGINNPNWRSPSFFRGVGSTTNQSLSFKWSRSISLGHRCCQWLSRCWRSSSRLGDLGDLGDLGFGRAQ